MRTFKLDQTPPPILRTLFVNVPLFKSLLVKTSYLLLRLCHFKKLVDPQISSGAVELNHTTKS